MSDIPLSGFKIYWKINIKEFDKNLTCLSYSICPETYVHIQICSEYSNNNADNVSRIFAHLGSFDSSFDISKSAEYLYACNTTQLISAPCDVMDECGPPRVIECVRLDSRIYDENYKDISKYSEKCMRHLRVICFCNHQHIGIYDKIYCYPRTGWIHWIMLNYQRYERKYVNKIMKLSVILDTFRLFNQFDFNLPQIISDYSDNI